MPDTPIHISGISGSAISIGNSGNVTNQVQAPGGPPQELDIPAAAEMPPLADGRNG
jgi:hypothetical protein